MLQLSLGEVLGLAAAVESCSEHPLAAAVLHFAAAHLAVPVASLHAELTAGLSQLDEPSEETQLLPSPSKAQRQSLPTVTATDWLQPATDVEVEEGEWQVVSVYHATQSISSVVMCASVTARMFYATRLHSRACLRCAQQHHQAVAAAVLLVP